MQIFDTAAAPRFLSLICVSVTPAPIRAVSGTVFFAALFDSKVDLNFSIASSPIARGQPILLVTGSDIAILFIRSLTVVSGKVYLFMILLTIVNFAVGQLNIDDIPAASEPMIVFSSEVNE